MRGYKFELFGNLKKKKNKQVHNTAGAEIAPSLSDSEISSPAPQPPLSSGIAPNPNPSSNIAADVNALVSKGMSEADMVKELKSRGYSFKEIDNVLGQAIKSQVSGENMPSMAAPVAAEQPELNIAPETSPPDFSKQMDYQKEHTKMESLEAMIESIVEERLVSFKQLIDATTESQNSLKGEIENLDTSLKMLETRTDNAVSDIKKEIDLLRDDFSTIEPKISSIESAFKDVIPNLVEAVSQVNEKLHIHSKALDKTSFDFEDNLDVSKEDNKNPHKDMEEKEDSDEKKERSETF
ncbi:MAG: hypothetical protein U9P44_02100 [archaeon]|nr:hypothetical protein [archaeon]